RVAEEIVAGPRPAIEVVARAAERYERDSVPLVDGELAPVVHAARRPVSLFRPRVVANLAGTRNAVEHPAELAADDVVRVHVAGRRDVAGALRGQRDDHQILEDAAGVARVQRPNVADVEPFRSERVPQID